MEPVRLGLIGGGLISGKHIEGSRNINNGDIVALCDVNKERKVLADELNIAFFTDYQEMLSQAELQGVIDATPNQFHAEMSAIKIRVMLLEFSGRSVGLILWGNSFFE